ncbi:hypothetical protein [Lysobacter enzymogenes]|uniref:hypothetical protein n=1 Tax=Lysobacter enzymogenes TaxID=69 RepID=UPI001A96E681|nr:hypothetical protein [Lysobacter enzymogenes]QQP96541.1 hypothetical protein JHW38_00335 [Lysobacter enzymogenes]
MSEVDTSSQEFKDAVAAAVAEATDGLKTKNAELLGKLKKAQKDSAIDPADLEAVERERDDLRTKLAEQTRLATKATKDLEAATKRAADIDTAYSGSLRDAALTEALTKAGVTSPALLKAAKALLGAQATVADENGARVVKAGDKAIGDFITEWAGSDEGKHFVTAADVSGGGAQGAGRVTGTEKRSQMSVSQKADYIGKHGLDAYNTLPE